MTFTATTTFIKDCSVTVFLPFLVVRLKA